jgi:hypothetical protein
MGSEDGNIFIWDIEKTETNYYKNAKQKAYEFFNPFLISKLDQEIYIKNLSATKGILPKSESLAIMDTNAQNNDSDDNDEQESQDRE